MIVVTIGAMTLFKASIFGFLWYSSTVCFGGEPSGTAIDSRITYKIIDFVSLLGGITIWISYQSCLTAKLAVDIKKYPFNECTRNSHISREVSWLLALIIMTLMFIICLLL